MGCWNATCGLTNLPIHEGDPVIAMYIAREGAETNFSPSYAWTNFSPASMIVRGEYNDYGSADLSEAETMKLNLTVEDSRRAFRAVEVDRPDGTKDTAYQMIKLDKGFDFNEGHNQDGPFGLWMAHASVFDAMVGTITHETYVRSAQDWITSTIKENTQRALTANLAKMEQDAADGLSFRMDSPWRESSTLVGAAIRYISDMMEPEVEVQGHRLVPKKNPEINHEMRAIVLDGWADLYSLYQIMDALRLTLHPQGGCGSQDGELQPYEAKIAAMQAVIDARKAKVAAWDTDEDFEEDDTASA